MPTIKKLVPRLSGKKPAETLERGIDKPSTSRLQLPTVKSKVSTKLQEQITLIYGEPGIGKSSLLSMFPKIIFCMFEPGVKNLSLYKLPEDKPAFMKWREFTPWVDTLCKTDQFENVVFDTAEWAYRRATEHVCEENGWDHVSDAGFAKGYDRADEEFAKQIGKLSASGKGVFFISHFKSEPFERPNGTKYNRLMPSLPNRAHAFIVGQADIVMYYGYAGEERRLFVGGNDFILTKCKPRDNFWTKSGERIVSIPMGEDEEEAYENLMLAWNNKQEEVGGITRNLDPTKRLAKVKPTK